jgi:hypothetical protein
MISMRFVPVALALAFALVAANGVAPAAPATAPCRQHLERGVLPVWARSGFSEPKPELPHVLGRSKRIVAIVFGYPLLSPPSPRRANKILWVARAPARPLSDLRISARLMRGADASGRVVERRVRGGPGPSIINLPGAGCWRLTLRWSGRSDTLDLVYARRD